MLKLRWLLSNCLVEESNAGHIKLWKTSLLYRLFVLVSLYLYFDTIFVFLDVCISTRQPSCRADRVEFGRLLNSINLCYRKFPYFIRALALNFNIWLSLKPVERLGGAGRMDVFQGARSVHLSWIKLSGWVSIRISYCADIRLISVSRACIWHSTPLTMEIVRSLVTAPTRDNL